jgi:hypothetical protein
MILIALVGLLRIIGTQGGSVYNYKVVLSGENLSVTWVGGGTAPTAPTGITYSLVGVTDGGMAEYKVSGSKLTKVNSSSKATSVTINAKVNGEMIASNDVSVG